MLDWRPARDSAALLTEPVTSALARWPMAAVVEAAAIDPTLADTAEFCAAYGVAASESANCVIVTGKRGGLSRYAACLVLATTRTDVNGVVRRLLDVRKASFASMDEAVSLTGMEYGGITAIGLPPAWRIFVAGEVARAGAVVIGSGNRSSKLRLPGEALLSLPGAELVGDLARPVG